MPVVAFGNIHCKMVLPCCNGNLAVRVSKWQQKLSFAQTTRCVSSLRSTKTKASCLRSTQSQLSITISSVKLRQMRPGSCSIPLQVSRSPLHIWKSVVLRKGVSAKRVASAITACMRWLKSRIQSNWSRWTTTCSIAATGSSPKSSIVGGWINSLAHWRQSKPLILK